jgi:hypothetical protein
MLEPSFIYNVDNFAHVKAILPCWAASAAYDSQSRCPVERNGIAGFASDFLCLRLCATEAGKEFLMAMGGQDESFAHITLLNFVKLGPEIAGASLKLDRGASHIQY